VTLKASGGQTTLFQNNLVNDNSTNSNSIAVRNLLGSNSISSAELKIDTGNAEEEGGAGTVALYDPIWVELDNGKTFTMKVSGEGEFLWGGENIVTVPEDNDGDNDNTITLSRDITTVLPGFTLDAPKHNVYLARGATLNVHQGVRIGTNLTVTDAPDAPSATINFYLPQDIEADDTLLTVDGAVTITGSTIRLSLLGEYDLTLTADQKIRLIDADADKGEDGDTDADDNSDFVDNDELQELEVEGASMTYQFTMSEKNDDLFIELTGIEGKKPQVEPCVEGDPNCPPDDNTGKGPQVEPCVKGDPDCPSPPEDDSDPPPRSLAEGALAGTALLNQGADFLIGQGLAAATGAESLRSGLSPFAVLGGGKLRHKTGSHLDLDSFHLIAGLSATRNVQAGELTLGAFFEHGEGDYTTHAQSVRGQGNADYSGGGLLARLKFNERPDGNHSYAEATARAGLIDLDFQASDLPGRHETRATYESAHLGLGQIVRLDEYSTLNLHGQFLWGRQGADTVKLDDGNEVKLSPIDSRRTRLGARWSTQDTARTRQLYFGAAWEREHEAKARIHSPDDPMTPPQLKGNTTVIEAGFVFRPTHPLTLEFNVQGHTGRREGVSGSFKVEYRF
jgi:hypothetical protein